MVIEDMDKCTKSPTGEHVWNYTPRPDNCRLGTCRYCEQQRVFEGGMEATIDLDRLFHSLEPEILNDPYIATLVKYIQHGTSFEDAIILTLKAMAARSKAEHDYLVTIIQNLPMSTIARR